MSTEITKSHNKLPRAVADGKIHMGDIEIDCAVLENAKQVIPRPSIFKLMGRSLGGVRPTYEVIRLRNQGVHIPDFLSANNLIPFIPSNLTSGDASVKFISKNGAKVRGYNAEIIPWIIDTYLGACVKGKLTENQLPIAATLEIISRGLTRVGISALVNEACGIPSTEKDYFQKILSEYISKELLPWTRRFPPHFFERYKKMYGISKGGQIPSHIGHFINTIIYKELSPGVLEELKRLNPRDEEGRRAHAHHQFLTPSKGILELDKQLIKVCAIMNLSDNKKDFDDKYKREKESSLT